MQCRAVRCSLETIELVGQIIYEGVLGAEPFMFFLVMAHHHMYLRFSLHMKSRFFIPQNSFDRFG